jgi:hypothetical protein
MVLGSSWVPAIGQSKESSRLLCTAQDCTLSKMESRWLLAKLTPMKSIMCIVRSHQGIFGTAISDPYLGFASPLASVATASEVERVIQEHKPGALALGWSMHPHQSLVDRRMHRDRLLEYDWKIPLFCTIEESHQISLEEAMRRKEKCGKRLIRRMEKPRRKRPWHSTAGFGNIVADGAIHLDDTMMNYVLTCVESSIETNYGIRFKKMEVPVKLLRCINLL